MYFGIYCAFHFFSAEGLILYMKHVAAAVPTLPFYLYEINQVTGNLGQCYTRILCDLWIRLSHLIFSFILVGCAWVRFTVI